MKVEHRLKDFIVEKEAKDCQFMLSNGYGSNYIFMDEPKTRFQGMFWYHDQHMYKIIEQIKFPESSDIKTIENRFSHCILKDDKSSKEFFMPKGKDCLAIDSKDEFKVQIDLDIRHAYDSREFGRYYSISTEKNIIVVKFLKLTDSKEDPAHGKTEYEIYVCIASDKPEFEPIKEFIENMYSIDEKRNSPPYSRFIYSALKLKSKRICISVSKNKKDAIKQAKYVYKKYDKLKRRDSLIESVFLEESELNQRRFLNKVNSIKNPLLRMGYVCSISSLMSLYVRNDKRIFAGLPWFFQYWTRDEAVSLKAFMLNEQFTIADRILKLQTSNIGPHGLVPNRIPESSLASADGAGWVFKRVEDLINASYKLSKKDMKYFQDNLEKSVYLQRKFLTKDTFVVNGAKETWMDTTAHNQDTRDGVRVEIQSAMLMMYSLLYCFEWDSKFRELEEKLRAKVREKLYVNDFLADGIWDNTKRPNVFLAYYLYPDLLSPQEWMSTFDAVLDALWLDWGGLSSIDKNHSLFRPEHTGQTNESYHRGDSWFWVNNMAALCMYRLDKYHYKQYIEKIISASTHEILFSGCIGHHAELSSANILKSEGCTIQAWSAATYVELVEEVMNEP